MKIRYSAPHLSTIKQQLHLYKAKLRTNETNNHQHAPVIDLYELINNALATYADYPLLGKDRLWYAKAKDPDLCSPNHVVFKCYAEIDSGICGVFYTLIAAEKAGFDLSALESVIAANWQKLWNDFLTSQQQRALSGGLLSGSSGIAIVLSQAIRNGWLEHSITNVNRISELLNRATDQLDLYHGIAGRGLAYLKCADLITFPSFAGDANLLASELLRLQEKNGSWKVQDASRGKQQIITGLFHGVAGIAYFLMVAGHYFNDRHQEEAARKAFDWLIRERKKNRALFLTANSKTRTVNPWLAYGFTGVAYALIKAFEYYHIMEYRTVACELLSGHPAFLTSNYNDWANGIAGLGEVYLEADRVFGGGGWKERAEALAMFLSQTSHFAGSPKRITWINGDATKATVDFLNGHSGILHFLLRLHQPHHIHFPFIHFEP